MTDRPINRPIAVHPAMTAPSPNLQSIAAKIKSTIKFNPKTNKITCVCGKENLHLDAQVQHLVVTHPEFTALNNTSVVCRCGKHFVKINTLFQHVYAAPIHAFTSGKAAMEELSMFARGIFGRKVKSSPDVQPAVQIGDMGSLATAVAGLAIDQASVPSVESVGVVAIADTDTDTTASTPPVAEFKPIRCCGVICRSALTLEHHKRTASSHKGYVCCGDLFPSIYSLKAHATSKHQGLILCCGKAFGTMQLHLNHVESDPVHRSMACCGMAFSSVELLEMHIRISRNHGPVDDDDDDEEKEESKVPLVTSSGRPLNKIICECGVSFQKEEHHQAHVASSEFHAIQMRELSSQSPPITCSCGMTFKVESHRQEHLDNSSVHQPRQMLLKNSSGPVTCHCGRTFKTSESHKIHLQESSTHKAQRSSRIEAQKKTQAALDDHASRYLKLWQRFRLGILATRIQQQVAEMQGQIAGAEKTLLEAYNSDSVEDMEKALKKLEELDLPGFKPAEAPSLPPVSATPEPSAPEPKEPDSSPIECTCGKIFTTKSGHEAHLRASTFHYFNVQHTMARQELSAPIMCSCGATFKLAIDHSQHMATASVHVKNGTAKTARSSYASQMKTISPESDAAAGIVLCNCRRAFINEEYFQEHVKFALFHQGQAEAGVELRMSARGTDDFRAACAGIPLHVCACGRVFMTRESSEGHLALAPYHNDKRPYGGFSKARKKAPKTVLEFDSESDSDSDISDKASSVSGAVLDSASSNIWGDIDMANPGRLNWSVCSASCGWCGLCWNIQQDSM